MCIGSGAAVDHALKRLNDSKKLMQISRGFYVRILTSPFGPRPPVADKMIESFVATTAETVTVSGGAAANRLRLTTQVPMKLIYLTSGRSRSSSGALTVTLRHAPPWLLLPAIASLGEAVRAIDWIGEPNAAEALATLKRTLPPPVLDELALRPALPA